MLQRIVPEIHSAGDQGCPFRWHGNGIAARGIPQDFMADSRERGAERFTSGRL